MKNYTGRVNGIDAQVTSGLAPRCQAFINVDDQNYIQVTATSHTLQTALELACCKNLEVEVTYDDSTTENSLARVRLLDR